jgi:hypothetical protein
MKKNDKGRQLLSRVITFLSREEMDFIDKVSKDSLFTTGTKLPRAKVIEAMVEAIREAGVNGEGVHNKDELIKKIANQIAKKAIEEMNKKGEIK